MDVRDFSERPVNDRRPPKPACKLKVLLQSLFPPPPGCPDYMVMNAATAGIPKPQLTEIRGILPENKKVPRGWPTCLKRLPPKAALHDNDIYAVYADESEHRKKSLKKKRHRSNKNQEKRI